MKNKLWFSLVLLLGLSMVLAACGGQQGGEGEGGADNTLEILTGGTGGTYYPLGGEMATIMSDNTDYQVTAITSGASVENMKKIQNGDAKLALVQTDIASYGSKGTLMFEGNKTDKVTAIGTLYPETIQIVTAADSGINSVEDLKGKTVSVGDSGSGTFENAKQILEVHGINIEEDITPQYLPFDESTEGIQDGTIDAAFITSGAPTGAVEGLSAVQPVKIIPIADDKAEALKEKYPYYANDVVPAGTYGLKNDVKTVAVLAMIVASSDLSEDQAYDLTKALFDNVDSIQHAKGEKISAESAVEGVGIDFHPGAKKYFEEKGVLGK